MAKGSVADVAGSVPGGGALAAGASALTAIVDPIAGMVSGLQELTGAMEDWVSKSNPGLVQQLGLAFDNLQAALGKIFAPILSLFIPILDALNNVFTKLGDTLKPIIDAVTGLYQAYIEYISTIFDVLMEALKLLQPVIDWVAKMIGKLQTALLYVVATIQVLVEMISGYDSAKGRVKSVAVQQSSYAGIEDIGKQFRLAALNKGGGSENPSEQRNKMLEELVEIKKEVLDFYNKVVDFIEGKAKVVEQAKEKAKKALDSPIGQAALFLSPAAYAAYQFLS
jgi:hypothetical protein